MLQAPDLDIRVLPFGKQGVGVAGSHQCGEDSMRRDKRHGRGGPMDPVMAEVFSLLNQREGASPEEELSPVLGKTRETPKKGRSSPDNSGRLLPTS